MTDDSVSDDSASVPVAVVDIDGVVADVRHRLHYLDAQGPKRWERFFAAAGQDAVLPEGAELVAELVRGHQILWLTGRPERLRPLTESWLARHQLPSGELLMRSDSDRRPAVDYKRSVLRALRRRNLTIAALVDDDQSVVDAAVAEGLPAVLADWLPRSDILGKAQHIHGRT